MDMSNQPPVRGTVVRLEGADMTLAYDNCPEPGFVLESRITRAKDYLLTLDAKLAAIKKDKNLSQTGREVGIRKLDAEYANVAALVDRVDEDALVLERLATALEASVYEVPALEPTDLHGRLDDGEIRQWLASLPEEQRRRHLDEVVAGKHPRHALALARSPVPTLEQQMGLAVLRASLPQEAHAQLKEVATRMATVRWTRSAPGGMRRALTRRNGGGTA